ncbi:MAG: hypothetical protein AAGF49_04645 [Pseudomonadota bacterium]
MAATLIEIARIYGLLGLGVAAVFLVVGIGRVSPDARGAYVFRPLLVPGIVLLWPAVVLRWIALERAQAGHSFSAYRPPRRAQDLGAVLLAIVVTLTLFLALLARQDGPLERPAERLDPPAQAPS